MLKKRWWLIEFVARGAGREIVSPEKQMMEFANRYELKPGEILVLGSGRCGLSAMYFASNDHSIVLRPKGYDAGAMNP